jgi:putative ABC transport system permease protein
MRHPAYTVTAVLTIALGIGANVAIFTILNHVRFRPLPYSHPDALVWISTWNRDRGQYSKSSLYDYDVWRKQTTTFEAVEAFYDRAFTLTGTQQPEGLVGWQFTPNLFAMLGARPALGRTFVEGDGMPGRDNVVVLSDELWRRRFGARADIVGQAVELDGRAYLIAGVMPATFTHPYPHTQLWAPVTFSNAALEDRKQRPLRVIARLKRGVTREQAEAELRTIAQQLARAHPDTHAGFDVTVRPLREFYIGSVGTLLWILQGTAGILLVIASANVASLVLVRATGRQRDTAVRLALGATRANLFRHHLGEGFALASIGAAGGLLLASCGAHVVPRLLASRLGTISLPDTVSGWLDYRVFVATALATLVIGVLFGVTPLLRRSDRLEASLRTSGRGSTIDRGTVLARNTIVAAQIALAVVLLVGAGLLVRSFARLQDRSFGFETAGVVTAQLLLPRDRYQTPAQSAMYLNDLVARVAALPGVETAAAVNTLPLTGFNAVRPHHLPGQPPQERLAEFRIVTADYFRTMAIPIRRGRAFDDRDRIGAPEVIIVNETTARRLWPDEDPIGQRLMIPDMLTFTAKEVVGIVGDTRHHDLAREPESEIYRPASQAYWPFFGLVLKTGSSPEALERSLREAAGRVDTSVPVSAVQALATLADTTWAWRRASMMLLTILALAAGSLAFIGVYGVMAYGVMQRSREIGVRMALGARPVDVARIVGVQCAWITGFGMAAGLVVASLVAGMLGSLLFGVEPLDPIAFAAASALTVGAGILAAVLPAVTAMRIDPTSALRGE